MVAHGACCSLAEGWLASLRRSLAPLAGAEGSRDSPQSLKLPGSYATLLAASALLEHPALEVQAAAAGTLEALARVEPLSGITLLPLVVRRLQRAVEAFLSGARRGPRQLKYRCLLAAAHEYRCLLAAGLCRGSITGRCQPQPATPATPRLVH